MTEKRFEMTITDSEGDFYYLDKLTDEKIKSTLTLENKLNELADENEQLKFELKECREHKLFSRRQLEEENEQLKAQLYCDYDEGVCRICKHHYLEKGNIFYISKCEKGHEKCSKESVRHCEDFEIKELQE